MDKNDESIPIQYREGKAPFMDIEVSVDERVLIPRPETELLVEVCADFCKSNNFKDPYILEIGTGSGIIPISLARMIDSSRVLSLDISNDALDLARDNVKKFDIASRITLMQSDMFSSLTDEHLSKFEVIVSNPPYVSARDFEKLDEWVQAEPRIALYAGEEGMDCLDIIAKEALRYLKPSGMVAVEVGYDQSEKMKKAFADNGLIDIRSIKDFSGHERVITGRKNG